MKKAMKVMLGLVAVLVAFSMIGCGEPDLTPKYLFQEKATIDAADGTVTLDKEGVTWSIKGCDNGDTDPNNDATYDATDKIYLDDNVVKVVEGYHTNGEDVVVRVFGTSTADPYKYGWYDITLNISKPVVIDPADVLLDTIEVTFNNAVDNLNWVVISQWGAFTLNGEQVTSKDNWWDAGNERTDPYYIKDGEKCELLVESTKAGPTDFVLEIWDTGACIDISTQIKHWEYHQDNMNAPTFTTTASANYGFQYGKKLNIIIERAANVVTVNVYEVIGELDKAEEEEGEGGEGEEGEGEALVLDVVYDFIENVPSTLPTTDTVISADWAVLPSTPAESDVVFEWIPTENRKGKFGGGLKISKGSSAEDMIKISSSADILVTVTYKFNGDYDAAKVRAINVGDKTDEMTSGIDDKNTEYTLTASASKEVIIGANGMNILKIETKAAN